MDDLSIIILVITATLLFVSWFYLDSEKRNKKFRSLHSTLVADYGNLDNIFFNYNSKSEKFILVLKDKGIIFGALPTDCAT